MLESRIALEILNVKENMTYILATGNNVQIMESIPLKSLYASDIIKKG